MSFDSFHLAGSRDAVCKFVRRSDVWKLNMWISGPIRFLLVSGRNKCGNVQVVSIPFIMYSDAIIYILVSSE